MSRSRVTGPSKTLRVIRKQVFLVLCCTKSSLISGDSRPDTASKRAAVLLYSVLKLCSGARHDKHGVLVPMNILRCLPVICDTAAALFHILLTALVVHALSAQCLGSLINLGRSKRLLKAVTGPSQWVLRDQAAAQLLIENWTVSLVSELMNIAAGPVRGYGARR